MGVTAIMSQKCDIERSAQTVKGDYNTLKSEAWQPHLSDVPCRLIPQTSNVRGIGGIVGEESNIALREPTKRVVRIILPAKTDITERDRVMNVRRRNGSVIMAGPINVLLLRPADRPTGVSHQNIIGEKIF